MVDWMLREGWDALVRGDGCPLCAALTTTVPLDPSGLTIADLGGGRLRLAANQFSPGYCVLICARHVREPYDLPAEQNATFFTDLLRVGRALERVLAPTKMNFHLLGNAVPHLHCHIIPCYHGDLAPAQPLDLDRPEHTRLLTPEEYEGWGARIREVLAAEAAL